MQRLQSTTCPCGRPMFENLSYCATCSRQRASSTKQTYTLPIRPTSKCLTPPPSQPSSPRRSTEVEVPLSSPYNSRRTPRRSTAGRVLNSALSLSSADEDDDDADDSDAESGGSNGPSLFPSGLYRQPSDYRRNGISSRRTSDESTGRDSSRTSSISATAKNGPTRQSSGTSSPANGEAPMAAAFARLSMKDVRAKEGSRRRDLSARMFEGAA